MYKDIQGPKNQKCLGLRCLCFHFAMQSISKSRAHQKDFDLHIKVTSEEKCPEWNGFNFALKRSEGQSPRPKTAVAYLPLLDMKYADPDTGLTAMIKAERILQDTGQDIYVCLHVTNSCIR